MTKYEILTFPPPQKSIFATVAVSTEQCGIMNNNMQNKQLGVKEKFARNDCAFE